MQMSHRIYAIALIFFSLPSIQGSSNPVKLESEILADFDGSSIGITGTVIARIKKYQSKIIDILLGTKDHATGKRHGRYEFENSLVSTQELVKIEENLKVKSDHSNAQITTCLKQMRRDFESISVEFRPVIHSAKAIMSILIEESCRKRNRIDSLLYVWAQTNEESELELFDKNLKSIKDFEVFLIDLYNFLEDLTFSCPKALKQFTDQLDKYKTDHAEKIKKVKELLPKCSVKPNNEAAFLNYIAQALDKIALHDITQQKISSFVTAFNKSH